MKHYLKIATLFAGIFFLQLTTAQEEVNADTTNEIVEDEFQEHFYEAMKQRGIENFDRAVTHLLKCKEIAPENLVIDFELGKNYTDLKQYERAVSYLEPIVNSNPDNIWYLEALLKVYERQRNAEKAIELAVKLAEKKPYFKQNLAFLYSQTGRYKEALTLVDELEEMYGQSYLLDSLRGHLNSVLEQNDTSEDRQEEGGVEAPGDIDQAIIEMYGLIKVESYADLLSMATQTLENYPSHPEAYYCKGVALNGLKRHEEAVEYLEMGLNYIIDDMKLQNNIYKQLVLAYKALGNVKKENEYKSKLNG